MKLRVVATAMTVCALTFGVAEGVRAQQGAFDRQGIYVSATGVAAIPLGNPGDIVDVGGGLTAALGWQFSPSLAIEGEFLGTWSSGEYSSIDIYYATYNFFAGPRVRVPIVPDTLALTAGAGIGVQIVEIEGSVSGSFFDVSASAEETLFAWQVKGGLEAPITQSLALVFDVRYAASADYAGDGTVGVGGGIRFGF
jgi:opacity protein-like surface antigen